MLVVRKHPGEALRDPLQLEDDRLVDHRTAYLGGGPSPTPRNRSPSSSRT